MVKFRPRGMVDKREMEQAQLFETADERGCTPMFGAAHRRGSACIGGFPPPAGLGVLPLFYQGATPPPAGRRCLVLLEEKGGRRNESPGAPTPPPLPPGS